MQSAPALNFVLLRVTDIEAAFTYFTEKLGLTTIPEQNAPTFRMFKGENGGIDFGIRLADKSEAGTVELYFSTNNLEGLRSILINKGIESTDITPRPFGSIFTAAAPDKHIVIMMGR